MSRRIVISEHVELAGQLADVDRLLLGDPFQDRVAAIDGCQRTRSAVSRADRSYSIRHFGLLETHNKH